MQRPKNGDVQSSIALPSGDSFFEISATSSRLLLTGQVAGSAPTTTCIAAPVDPGMLRLLPAFSGSCSDPALTGHTVGVSSTYLPGSQTVTVAIAIVDPTTGETSTGPRVMTYEDASDARPVTAYGPGRLWIYEVATTRGPEVLQVDSTTGRVQASAAMPRLYRPLLAANDEGLWVGNSVEGSDDLVPLYRLDPGSSRPSVVVADTSQVTCWMVGDGTHLWVGMGQQHGCAQQSIWRFDGMNPTPVFRTPDRGFVPDSVVGNEAAGLWTVQWLDPTSFNHPTPELRNLVRIDPDTGAEQTMAALPAIPGPPSDDGRALRPGQAVFFHGALYLLEQPFRNDGSLGYSTLRKVTPCT